VHLTTTDGALSCGLASGCTGGIRFGDNVEEIKKVLMQPPAPEVMDEMLHAQVRAQPFAHSSMVLPMLLLWLGPRTSKVQWQ